MKIGVALSGCDIGGVYASTVLHWMRQEKILTGDVMLSTSGIASPAALLFRCGFNEARCEFYQKEFLQHRQESDLDYAIAELSAKLLPQPLDDITGLVINSFDLHTGQAICFTNDFAFDTNTLRTFPLTDPYDALSAGIGTIDGLCSFPYRGHRLCDYSVQYGCPFHPLHLAGCEKILSFSFEPETALSPYDVLITHRIWESCQDADLHISLTFPAVEPSSPEQYRDSILQSLCQNKNAILNAVLFQ